MRFRDRFSVSTALSLIQHEVCRALGEARSYFIRNKEGMRGIVPGNVLSARYRDCLIATIGLSGRTPGRKLGLYLTKNPMLSSEAR